MSSTEQARWFVLGGDHLVLLDERGQIPQGPRACLPVHLHSAHFESFDEWDGLPCYLLDLGPDAESPPLAGLRQLMVAGTRRGFASPVAPGSWPPSAAPIASAANVAPP